MTVKIIRDKCIGCGLCASIAPKALIDKVDFVNEIIDVKHPRKIPTTKGVQY